MQLAVAIEHDDIARGQDILARIRQVRERPTAR